MDHWWSRAIFFACGVRREGDEYLETVLKKVDVPEGLSLVFAFQLGLLAQSALFASRQIKTSAVQEALRCFVEGWNDLAHAELLVEDKVQVPISHSFLLSVYCDILGFALGSKMLKGALEGVRKNLQDRPKVINPAQTETIRDEWFSFFLAIASLDAEDVKGFCDLVESDRITDPLFLEICRYGASMVSKWDWIDQDEKAQLEQATKRLRRRTKQHKGYIADQGRISPRPISSESLPGNTKS